MSNHVLNAFILLLQKNVYPYEYLNDREKFNETLPEKEDFYSYLNMEENYDVDYTNLQIMLKYVPLNILAWSWSLSLCTRLSMASSLKKESKVKLYALVIDIDVINGRKKTLEVEYVMPVMDMWKLISNTWKIMIKIKNQHVSSIGM